jgi:nucleoside-diphosphate-sugar epimerase
MVIGGTRFVGLRLVKTLVEYGHEITLLNRGKTQVDLPSGVKRLHADRRNPAEISQVLKSQDFEMVCDMTGYQLKNLEPVVVTLRDRIGHYIFQSTCAVYAPSELLPIRENFPTVTEATAPAGEETYALEKLQCEQFLLRMFDENHFPVTIFRSPVIYGPENWMDEREGSYFVRLLQGRRILVPGTGATVLQFVNVDDIAKAYIAVNGQKKALGGIYNIASEEAITIDGYIDTIARVIGITPSKVYVEPHVVRNLKRPIFFFPWERSSFYDISKAKDEFGYRPLFNMEEGLKLTYEWWLKSRGINNTSFIPGKMGYDVDLTYEDDVLAKYG